MPSVPGSDTPPWLERLLAKDPWLTPYREALLQRRHTLDAARRKLLGPDMSLIDIAREHAYFGLHREAEGWVFREWAPRAHPVYLLGTFGA